MLRRQIVPSALADFKRIASTYAIGSELNSWCHWIVADINSSSPSAIGLEEIPFDQILDIAEGITAISCTDWRRSWERFRQSGAITKLKGNRSHPGGDE